MTRSEIGNIILVNEYQIALRRVRRSCPDLDKRHQNSTAVKEVAELWEISMKEVYRAIRWDRAQTATQKTHFVSTIS